VLLCDPPRNRIPRLDSGVARAGAPEPEEWITLAESDRRYVRRVIERARGRVTGPGGVAEILGLNPSTANWRISRLGLKPDLLRARGGVRARSPHLRGRGSQDGESPEAAPRPRGPGQSPATGGAPRV